MAAKPVQTCDVIWQNCLSFIKDNIPDDLYQQWFVPIHAISLKDDILTIGLPAYSFYEWLEKNAQRLLKTVVKKEIGNNGKLMYTITMGKKPDKKEDITLTLPAKPPHPDPEPAAESHQQPV